jgi:hypothetical protein|nr:MAG TPA: Protein of unknown function (DUF1492) [Caudoviricetes sp.]
MTAKEYLGQAYRLDQRITSKLQQIDSLRSLTRKVTASYDGEVVSRTRNVHSLEDAIIRLMEAEEEINRQVDELIHLKIDIGETINKVRNESYRLILEKRYLCFLPWDQIASEMHYSRRWVLNKHERSLEVVDRLLAEKEDLA